MAAAGFLALASTFKHGEHIRVTLLLNSLSPAGSRRLDIFALAVGCLLAAAFAFFSVKLTYDSWHSTTSPRPTTPRRSGFPRSAWPWARSCSWSPCSMSWSGARAASPPLLRSKPMNELLVITLLVVSIFALLGCGVGSA